MYRTGGGQRPLAPSPERLGASAPATGVGWEMVGLSFTRKTILALAWSGVPVLLAPPRAGPGRFGTTSPPFPGSDCPWASMQLPLPSSGALLSRGAIPRKHGWGGTAHLRPRLRKEPRGPGCWALPSSTLRPLISLPLAIKPPTGAWPSRVAGRAAVPTTGLLPAWPLFQQ